MPRRGNAGKRGGETAAREVQQFQTIGMENALLAHGSAFAFPLPRRVPFAPCVSVSSSLPPSWSASRLRARATRSLQEPRIDPQPEPEATHAAAELDLEGIRAAGF